MNVTESGITIFMTLREKSLYVEGPSMFEGEGYGRQRKIKQEFLFFKIIQLFVWCVYWLVHKSKR